MTTVTVKASGGDYTSFVTAEATEQKTLGSAEVFYIEGYKGTYGGGGVNYVSENLTIAGWGGLAADAYVHVRAASGEEHTGIPVSSGNYTGIGIKNAITSGSPDTVNCGQDFCRITDLILGQPQTIAYANVCDGIRIDGDRDDTYIERNIILSEAAVSECGYAIYCRPHLYTASGRLAHVRDNLICANDDGASNGWGDGIYLRGEAYARNNTVLHITTGITGVAQSGSSPIAKNNIVEATTCFSGTFATEDYNIASDTTTTGGNSQNSVTLTFNDAANLDYSLDSTDTEADAEGIGPSSDSDVNSTDIIGTSRSGTTCSVGAFEYVAAGGLGIPIVMRHRKMLGMS